MTSAEIVKKRKKIEEEYMEKVNIFNGQLTSTRSDYLEHLADLQKECPHLWDNGEAAIVKLGKEYVCTICKKKIDT